MNTELFLSLVTAAGLGSIFTTLIQNVLSSSREKRQKLFNERKEVCVGLLNSIKDVKVEPGLKSRTEFAYRIERIRLVSPLETVKALEALKQASNENNDYGPELSQLVELMRNDLEI